MLKEFIQESEYQAINAEIATLMDLIAESRKKRGDTTLALVDVTPAHADLFAKQANVMLKDVLQGTMIFSLANKVGFDDKVPGGADLIVEARSKIYKSATMLAVCALMVMRATAPKQEG